jgi:hypothetical protein
MQSPPTRAEVLEQATTRASGDGRSYRFSHRATIHLPAHCIIHPVQRHEPTICVADRHADADVELSGSLQRLAYDLPSFEKGKHVLSFRRSPFHSARAPHYGAAADLRLLPL